MQMRNIPVDEHEDMAVPTPTNNYYLTRSGNLLPLVLDRLIRLIYI